MQVHRPVPRSLEQRRGEALRVRALEEIDRHPARLIRIPVRGDLVSVAGPPEAIAVGADRVRNVPLEATRVPKLLARDRETLHFDAAPLRSLPDPFAQRRP